MANVRALSCLQCKRRKVKCDRNNPCNQCLVRDEGAECRALTQFSTVSGSVPVPVAHRTPSTDKVQSKDDVCNANHSLLHDRLIALEDRLRSVERTIRPSARHSHGDSRHKRYLEEADQDSEQLSLMAEDVAMGYRAKRARPNDRESKETSTNVMDQRSSDHVADVIFQYITLLPSESIVRQLLRFYFQELDWFSRSLDVLAFNAHVDSIYVNMRSNGNVADVDRINAPFFSCFLMVICLSLHFMDDDHLQALNLTKPETLAESMFAGAQQILWASNFLGNCQLDHLACIILMGLYQYDKRDQADAHWTLLGSATKAAQILGLSDLDNETRWQERGATHLQRARRIWWSLIWFDWSHAFGHKGRYSIVPDQNKTSISERVQEDTLLDVNKQHTENSFSVARSLLVCFYREVCDLYNANGPQRHLTIEETMDLDVRLNKLFDKLPAVYADVSLDTMSIEQAYETLFVQLNKHNRTLRLHRHFLVQSQRNNTLSRRKCLEAASAIVSLIRLASERHKVLTRMWIIVLYAIGAGLALFQEQCQRDVQSAEIEEQLDTLTITLEENQHRSQSARNAARLLRRLRRLDSAKVSNRRSGKEILIEVIDKFERPEGGRSRRRTSGVDAGTASDQHTAPIDPLFGIQDASTLLDALGVGHGVEMGLSAGFGNFLDI